LRQQPMPDPQNLVRLLLVDDEVSIREPLAEYLASQGFVVTAAENAAIARDLLSVADPHLVICDIMMPGEDGLSLTRHLRETLGLPVILLTARAEETERIIGLEIGADDYVVKPFSPRELVARIRAVLRRAQSTPSGAAGEGEVYHFGDYRLVEAERALHSGDVVTELSAGEFQLLLALVRHPRQVMSRDRLLDLVRGRDADIFDRSIDNLISRLRRKLGDDPREPTWIRTVWGGGYSFAGDVRRSGHAAA
jgi:two-component system, OmpR family, response regulator